MQHPEYILELEDIDIVSDDRFVLNHISLQVPDNCLFTILGNNMSGKSLLIKSICGVTQPKSGSVIYNSAPVCFKSELEARANGIYYFSYKPQIVPELTVRENLILGSEKRYGASLLSVPRKSSRVLSELLERYHISLDFNARAGKLSFYQQHLISFLRAILNGCRLFIFDELITYCSPSELSDLKIFIQNLLKDGKTIICLTQHLNALTLESDYYYVMPAAQETSAKDIQVLSREQYQHTLASRQYETNKYPYISMSRGEALLKASLESFTFSIHESETVGITGDSVPYLEYIFDVLSGRKDSRNDRLTIKGCPVTASKNQAFIKRHISYLSGVPSNNLLDNLDVKNNIFLANYSSVSNKGVLSPQKMAALSYEYVTLLNMQNVSFHSMTDHLSSGTKQKIAISKALNAGSILYFFNTPTANLDPSSSIDFYNIINSLKHHGRGICILSYDIDELCGICDRIYVFKENAVPVEYKKSSAARQHIKEALL